MTSEIVGGFLIAALVLGFGETVRRVTLSRVKPEGRMSDLSDYRKMVVPKLQHFVMECARLQSEVDEVWAYLDRAIGSFERDPPDNEFQRGFLAAMETARDDLFKTQVDHPPASECPLCQAGICPIGRNFKVT